MTKELELSIERLYSTFSRYPFRSEIDGCPCCVSESDKEKLHTKKLRSLEEEDLSRYAFKAITTWGDVEDFKHFLPRILELLSTTNFIVNTFVVLGKVNYGNWTSWPGDEQTAIKEFLISWWTDSVKHKTYFDKEAFVEIYKLLGDIELLINKWVLSFEDNSFITYIDLVINYYKDLLYGKKSFKEIDKETIDKVLAWINDRKGMIEKGFFYFEKVDPEFAEEVSRALYIVEHIK
ncbi:hypothetical protein Hsw_1577 [Sporocytophaga myxococcoides]|uniref:Uncharacterized protein n=1 Tax=Sporocytophaga myxococcoides TaxID=153721 RepID=A0A098LIX9_9BACT|nr:hypothetical protein [Sporocytophaga myxococcoides]GAL86123.1 hypothetical protein Hsw_1577 [Sporocytophaga myxococcoides]